MKGRALRICAPGLFLLALLAAPPAQAQTPPANDNWAAALNLAMAWIRANSPYTDLTSPRFWVSLLPEDMAAKVMNRDVTAFYVCTENALYNRTDFNIANIFGASILVHELVHHGQCVARRARDSCVWEREAYALQAKYLRGYKDGLDAANADRVERVAADVEQTAERACAQMRTR